MKIAATLSALLLSASASFAQISFGPAAGFQLTSYRFAINGSKLNKGVINMAGNLHGGGIAEIAFTNRLRLQPGVLFSSNSYYPNNDPYGFSIHAIDIPVVLTYHTGMKHQSHFFFGIGPYASVNVGGTSTFMLVDIAGNPLSDPITAKLTYGSKEPSQLTRFGAGAVAYAGRQFKRGLFVRLNYQLGLKNLQPAPQNQDYSITNSNVGLTLGYLFRTKNKKEKTEAASKPKPSY